MINHLGSVSSVFGYAEFTTQRAKMRSEVDNSESEVRWVQAEIVKSFPQYATLVDPKPLSVADVRALLRDDETLITMLVGSSTSFGLGGQARAHRLGRDQGATGACRGLEVWPGLGRGSAPAKRSFSVGLHCTQGSSKAWPCSCSSARCR
jgi:hypothetical protein